MYDRQTKDNKKWCDLANLTNVYNSDNIHHYMVDNMSQTFNLQIYQHQYCHSDVTIMLSWFHVILLTINEEFSRNKTRKNLQFTSFNFIYLSHC